MNPFFRAAPLLIALAGAGHALAQPADDHAAHHPEVSAAQAAPPASPDAKGPDQKADAAPGCPMMSGANGHMSGQAMPGQGMGGQMGGGSGRMEMGSGHMMSYDQMQRCMAADQKARPHPSHHRRRHKPS